MEPPKVDTAESKDGNAGPKFDPVAYKDGIAAPKVDVAAGKDYIDTQFRSFFLKQINKLNISILIGLALYTPPMIRMSLKWGERRKNPGNGIGMGSSISLPVFWPIPLLKEEIREVLK